MNTSMLQGEYFGNSVENWFLAVGAFIATFVVLWIFRTVIIGRLHELTKKSHLRFDDALIRVLGRISLFFYFTVSLFFAAKHLVLPAVASEIIYGIFVVGIVYEGIGIVERVSLFFVERVWLRKADQGERDQISHLLRIIIKIVLWSTGVLLVLSNLGFDVTSLIAGLGVGGVAVALAVQSILGDLFSSISIYFDQPFRVGDFIIVGDDMGVVKKIGLKSTRIQALGGEELVISNNELTSTRISNYKKMQRRRVPFKIGVTYDTPPEKLRKIGSIAKEVIEAQENVEFDRAHFYEFGDFSLNCEIVYFILSSDYNVYMDTQQAISLGLIERFAKEGIEFAFPTQTLHLMKN